MIPLVVIPGLEIPGSLIVSLQAYMETWKMPREPPKIHLRAAFSTIFYCGDSLKKKKKPIFFCSAA